MQSARRLAILVLAACNTHLSLENLPCPCVTGWECCPGDNVCVRPGTSATSDG